MRTIKELEAIVADTIRVSGGTAPFTIPAHNAAEADAIKAILKGKRNTKTIDVWVAPPETFKTIGTRWAEGEDQKFRNAEKALKQ